MKKPSAKTRRRRAAPRFLRHSGAKPGQPPGTLVHTGELTEPTRARITLYDNQSLEKIEIHEPGQLKAARERGQRLWLHTTGLADVDWLRQVGRAFSLHPLVLEDVLNPHQRPKLEDYGDYHFIVLRLVHYEETDSQVHSPQVSLVLGRDFLLSFFEEKTQLLKPLHDHLERRMGRIRELGVDFLTYSLLDIVVDQYMLQVERLGETIEAIEEAVIREAALDTLQRLHHVKSDLLAIGKAIWPLREIVGKLMRREAGGLIGRETEHYLRDLEDHTHRLIETLEFYHDMLDGIRELYMGRLTLRTSEIMRVLTIIATIFIPLTFMVGIWGMNFEYMPELEWRWAYPAVLGTMAAIALALLIFFRIRKWL